MGAAARVYLASERKDALTTAGKWVMSAYGVPCGALELGPAGDGRVWLDMCTLGQHLPQMYPPDDIRDLTADGCARLGLCPDCLGFGDLNRIPASDLLAAARGIDEVKQLCPNCGGSGRPALRVTVKRGMAGTTGEIRPLPHKYVPPLGGEDPAILAAFGVQPGLCLACSMLEDGEGPRGEALHT